MLRALCLFSMGDGEDMFKLSVLNVLARVNDKKITRINKVRFSAVL